MAVFHYQAVTAAGDVVDGRLEAASRAEAVARLQDQGYLPIRAEAQAPARSFVRQGRGLGARDVTLLFRGLATLLAAGLPLDRALALQLDQADQRSGRALLERVAQRVKQGTALSDSLAAEGDIFPAYAVGMVRAGEASGALDTVLQRLADFQERRLQAREQIRSALIYPVLLLAMSGATVVILLTVVLPQFEAMFQDAGEALPAGARVVVAVGALVRGYGVFGAASLALGGLAVNRWRRTAPGRRAVGRLLLRLPLAGRLHVAAETAMFCRTLGTLLGGGLHMLQALAIARDTVGNPILRELLEQAEGELQRGEGLSEPLARAGIFPTLALRLMRVGEESGRLEPMLLKIADLYDDEVRRDVGRLMALLVPVLTIALGATVAAIIGAILSALLSVYSLPL